MYNNFDIIVYVDVGVYGQRDSTRPPTVPSAEVMPSRGLVPSAQENVVPSGHVMYNLLVTTLSLFKSVIQRNLLLKILHG